MAEEVKTEPTNEQVKDVAPKTEEKPLSDADKYRKAISELDDASIMAAVQYINIGEQEYQRKLKAEADKDRAVPEKKPADHNGDDDPIKRLEKQITEMRAEREQEKAAIKARQEAEKTKFEQEQQAKRFYAIVDGALKDDPELAEDEDARDDVASDYTGHWLRLYNKGEAPQDIAKSVKSFLASRLEKAAKRAKGESRRLIESKIEARKARGETGAGSAKSSEEIEFSADDIRSGKAAEWMKAALMGS